MTLSERLAEIPAQYDSKFSRVIEMADRFAAIQPRETVWTEDRLLDNIREPKHVHAEPGFVYVAK